MAKAVAEIRSLARAHTESAIKTLVGIMNKRDAPPAARVAAAGQILDRGWGKAATVLTDADGGPIQVLVTRYSDGPANS